MVHVVRLGERERLSNEARKPLPQSVDPPLDVGSLAFLLAGGLMLLLRDYLLVSLPQVAVAARLLVAFGDRLPQPFTARSAPIAHHESHDLARPSAQGEPDPHLLALAMNEGPQFIQFEHLALGGRLGEEECSF